jgi:hypothetical protein
VGFIDGLAFRVYPLINDFKDLVVPPSEPTLSKRDIAVAKDMFQGWSRAAADRTVELHYRVAPPAQVIRSGKRVVCGVTYKFKVRVCASCNQFVPLKIFPHFRVTVLELSLHD